jgi:hypothetical protein
MSAYIVEDKTINRIITFLNDDRDGSYCKDKLTRLGYIGKLGQNLGQAMYNLNCLSICERYGEGEDKEMGAGEYTFRYEPSSRIQAYKSLQCFLYQACEGECDTDPLYLALNDIKHSWAGIIVYNLDSYDKAQWG